MSQKKGTIQIRLTDEDGRQLTMSLHARGKKTMRQIISDTIVDQAEGRTTLFDFELRPGSAFEHRRA